MATLQNIRKRGPLVALIIGFALLAFILGDFLTQGQSLFARNQNQVAEIAGNSVSIREYQRKIEELTEIQKIQNNGAPLTEQQMEQIRSQAWEQLINEYMMMEEYNELGLSVSPEEVYDLVSGQNVDPLVRQAFTNRQTGQFNPADVINFLKNIEQDQTGQSKAMWLYIESEVINRRYFSKYNALITQGLFATEPEARMAYEEQNKKVDFKYVVKLFTSIPDSTVKITQSEIENYYEEHKNQYEQEESRDIAYVAFDLEPTPEDVEVIKEEMLEIKQDFEKASDDVAFVNANSDIEHRFDYKHYKRGELSPEIDSVMFFEQEGYIHGPYREEDAYKLAKLVERVQLPDSVKARHILIRPKQNFTIEQAVNRVDSLKQVIEQGGNFAQLAQQYGEDGTAQKGGDLGWFTEGAMVKAFNDTVFDNNVKPGDLIVVQTQFGAHLVKVEDKTEPIEKVQVGVITQPLEPSPETYENIYAEATKFAGMYNTEEKFDQAIGEQGLEKRLAPNIRPMDNQIAGLESPRELIKWAYSAEKGQVSNVYELGDRLVIAMVAKIREEGIAPLEQVKDEIEIEVREDKKAEQIMQLVNNPSSLNELAKTFESSIYEAQNISFSAFQIPERGPEPKVVAAANTLPVNTISKPLKGNQGVYVLEVTKIKEAEPVEDVSVQKQQLEQQMMNRASYQVYDALKEAADIEDNRAKFY